MRPPQKNLLSAALLLAAFGSALSTYAQFDPVPGASVNRTTDMAQMQWQLGLTWPTLPPKLQDINRTTSYNARPSNAASPEGNWTDDNAQTITRSGAGLWNNYDDVAEAFKPGPQPWRAGMTLYAPIDDLKMKNGTPITTPAQWWAARRPEIFEATQEELYGRIPDASRWPGISWTVANASPATGTTNGVAWKGYTVTGTILTTATAEVPAANGTWTMPSGSSFVPFTPRNLPRLTFNVRIPQTASAANPVGMIVVFGSNATFQYTAQYGYGVAGYSNTQLQPDSGNASNPAGPALSSYIIGLINQGNWRAPNDWGSLAAWSWGISRFIDYLEASGGAYMGVNPKRLGVEGHSRNGKAALVAGAYEPRILATWASSAGSLGTAPYRRHYGQELANSVWDQEYHWMAGNFMKWATQMTPDGVLGTVETNTDGDGNPVLPAIGRGTYLPTKKALMSIEAHSVASLVAPRALMITGGNNGDDWQDPYGMFLTARDTAPVYNLLGRRGLILTNGVSKPEVNVDNIEGHVSYRYHQGGHSDTFDWPTFAKFAAKFFNDNTAPVLGLPMDQTVLPTGEAGAVVNFDAPLALDAVDDVTPVTANHVSGETYPIGVTTVTASSTDISGNTVTGSFTITVTPMTVTRGGFVLNRRTNQVTQQVTLKNVSSAPVVGPIYLALDALSTNTLLVNSSGTTGGSPYVVVPGAPLAPGASVTIVLTFANPVTGGITYNPRTPAAL